MTTCLSKLVTESQVVGKVFLLVSILWDSVRCWLGTQAFQMYETTSEVCKDRGRKGRREQVSQF